MKTKVSSTKASSMSALMATKGGATPSSDVLPRGEDHTSSAPAPAPAPAKELHTDPAPVATAPGAAANTADLAALLEALNNQSADAPAQELPKVTINVKLDQAIEQKLKQIVGFQKMKRMSNFSQQDWLESRISALVKLEHSQLPKF